MKLTSVLSHKWILWVILAAALFLRVFRAPDLMGFYFDQGRDAKVIWNLWHSHKTFLIGPTTGIEGIFLGPLFYYLIAPFYLLGNGNPVFPAVALALGNVLGIYVIYFIGTKFFSKTSGLLAAFFITFSLPLIQAHRWLSNPNPLSWSSALAVLCLLKIINGSKSFWTWFLFGLVLGASLQFEAASAVFFLPATALTFLLFRKNISWSQNFIHTLFSFFLTLVPQLVFNFRHQNILFDSFHRFLIADKSFAPVLWNFYPSRLLFYFDAFTQKLFFDRPTALALSLVFLALLFVVYKKIASKNLSTLLIWCLTPLVFLLFYHGNNGYVWDYYFTGVYSIFLLVVSIVLAKSYSLHSPYTHIAVGLFVITFFVTNIYQTHQYFSTSLSSDKSIVLGTSLAAVNWIYKDAGSTPFNVDVYVPPVVPYSYDYLFIWQGNTVYHRFPVPERLSPLYLIYESDPPHPERLSAWMNRQNGISTFVDIIHFGGVTVERRQRL